VVDFEEGPMVAAAVTTRTREVVEALRSLDEPGLVAPSELEGWSRLTIACHLRYGAEALRWMTMDTLGGRPTSFYPSGRAEGRRGTLEPAPGETPSQVVGSLADRSRELHQTWEEVTGADWDGIVHEPPENPDLGPLPLVRLALARLTEVEVHGTDLGLGLGAWSALFVRAALGFRLDWLTVRRSNHRPVDDSLHGSWLLVGSDGPVRLVTVAGSTVRSEPADGNTSATAVIEGTSRDLLAMLLGRPPHHPLRISGDRAFGTSFSRAFPGP
jgi:uncharacterized protein (TIGR03083 family)